MYVKINGSDEHYNVKIMPFSTQHGNDGIKVVGDMPRTESGFKLYNDDDSVYNDYSDYVYLYGKDGYTKVEETVEVGECTFEPIPPSAYSKLSRRISSVNNRVNEITPYTETKMAYYGEKEKIFYNAPTGNVSVFFDNYNGDYSINRVENRLIISFDTLTKSTNVTISIQ